MARTVCAEPGCPTVVDRGRCDQHRRGDQRGPRFRYGGRRWRRIRAQFLAANPACLDCGGSATVADHAPVSRRELIARGEAHPDAHRHLQPRCASCHSRRTVAVDGGFGKGRS